MVTVVWNRGEFHLIDVLVKGRKFNTAYYVTELLSLLYLYGVQVVPRDTNEN
jgi:hypothetical protein